MRGIFFALLPVFIGPWRVDADLAQSKDFELTLPKIGDLVGGFGLSMVNVQGDVNIAFNFGSKAKDEVIESIGRASKLVRNVVAPVAAALGAFEIVKEQLQFVEDAKGADADAMREAESWPPIVKEVEKVVEKAAKQAQEDIMLQMVRADEAEAMGDQAGLESLLEAHLDKLSALESDQQEHLIVPLDKVNQCTTSIRSASAQYGDKWAIQKWWGSTEHKEKMQSLRACISTNMKVLSVGINIFNSNHLLDIKKRLWDGIRATDALRAEVRQHAVQHLAMVDSNMQTLSSQHGESLQLMQEMQRASADQAMALSNGMSENTAQVMSGLQALDAGQKSLSRQVLEVQQAVSGQMATNHEEALAGIGHLTESQAAMSKQMQHNHDEHMASLALARQDIATSQLKTQEGFRRLLATLSMSAVETKGYLEATVKILAQELQAQREMQRESLNAVTASSNTSQTLLTQSTRQDDEIRHLNQQLREETARSNELQTECKLSSMTANHTLHEANAKTEAAKAADSTTAVCLVALAKVMWGLRYAVTADGRRLVMELAAAPWQVQQAALSSLAVDAALLWVLGLKIITHPLAGLKWLVL